MKAPDKDPRRERLLAENPNAVTSEVVFTVRLSLPEDTDGRKHKQYPLVTDLSKNLWLYVFSIDGHLQHELYADPYGRYRVVNPGENVGKDYRPFMEGPGSVCSNVVLVAGSRLNKAQGGTFNPCSYYVVSSPCQLAWKRFPHILDAGKASEFEKWVVNTRHVEHVVLKNQDKQEALVEVPWVTALSLSQAFQQQQGKWWAKLFEDTAGLQRGQLRACVHTANSFLEQGSGRRPLFKLIDDVAFHDEEQKYFDEVGNLDDDLAHIRARLLTQLRSPAMQLLKQDALASPDPRAPSICRAIWANALTNLDAPGGDMQFLEEFYKYNPGLFPAGKPIKQTASDIAKWLDDHPELNLREREKYADVAVKQAESLADENLELYPYGRPKWSKGETIKAIKEDWYFLKSFVAFIDKENPKSLKEAFKDVGWLLFGVRPSKTTRPSRLAPQSAANPEWTGAFSFKSASRLAKKIAASPLFNEFIATVDGYYLGKTVEEYSKQPKDKRELAPVISATMSFMNSTVSALAAGMKSQGIKKLNQGSVSALVAGLDEAPVTRIPFKKLTRPQALLRLRTMANSPEGIQLLGKAFGFVGAAFGTYSAVARAGEASARSDSAAAWGYGIVAGANAATMAGYALGGAAIVVAALVGSTVGLPATLALAGMLLITGGSGVSLLGSVLMPLLEHDPLELWLLYSPWGRERDKDSNNIDLQFAKYYRALAGFKVDCIASVLKEHFVLTVQSRLARTPEEVWVGYTYVSEAGAFRRAFGPLTVSDCKSGEPHTYELKVFCDNPRLVNAEVQIRPNREDIPPYPEKPDTPSFPFKG